MKLQELQDALAKAKSLMIKGGQVCIGDKAFPVRSLCPFDEGEGIKIEYDTPGKGTDAHVLEGKTSSLFIEKHLDIFKNLEKPIEVQATVELARNQNALDVTLRYKLYKQPEGWRFLCSFPGLPIPFDSKSQRYDASGQSVLDTVKFESCYLYLTTYEHKLTDDAIPGDISLKEPIQLKEGLNFVGRGAPQGTLALLAQLGKGAPPVLHGQVIPRPSGNLRKLQRDQLPWDAKPPIPGIHLKVPLSSGLSLPPEGKALIAFKDLRFEMYSPLSRYWRFEDASYEPVMAYLGDVEIGTLKLVTVSASVVSGRDDELVFACRFGKDITLNGLLDALTAPAAKEDEAKKDRYSFLPEPLRKVIGPIGPRSASITLVRSSSGSGYEVASMQLTIGMEEEAKEWSPFGKLGELELITLGLESVRLAVVKPFESKERSFFATISGRTTFLGVKLDLTLEAPSLYFSAEQTGSWTIDLQTYFKNQFKMETLPLKFLTPKVNIENLRLVADPGSYYSFAVDIIPDMELKIAGKALPNLRFAVSCSPEEKKNNLDWQFEARAKPGEGVPIVDLIVWLADQVKITLSPPKSVRDLIIIDSMAVSYNSRSEDFGFECWGKLTLNKTILNCCFTVNYKGGADTIFGGRILFGPEDEDPLSFSLIFGKNTESTCALAAYNDPFGHELNIQKLAKAIFSPPKPISSSDSEVEIPRTEEPSLADLIPRSLTMTLKSALLAYYKKPAANSKEETVVLFGVDLGAKVELSDLPVVGKAMPKGQAIGFESLRIIVASAALEQKDVEGLDEILLAEGIKPLSDVAGKGDGKGGLQKFNIAAELLFGSVSRNLSLPIQETEQTPAEPGAGGPSTAPKQGEETADPTKWFEIDKSMGPVSVRRIGLGYENGRVGIKFDASLQLKALTFNLEGLGLTYPLDKFTEPSQFLKHVKFNLDGMGLALGNGPIEIGGSLVRIPRKDPKELELEGTLLIRTAVFTFSAFGSYVKLADGTPSVMAFAVLLLELGDPTGTGAFVVTGLAFGFGVHRKLTLPRIEEVHTFPLIQAAMGKQDFSNLQRLPQQLRPYVAPSPGNFWIAGGIKFNSFGMVNSFLLVSVSFGSEVEIGLLGLSQMTVPPLVQPEDAIASAELALRGVIRIAEGLIQFEAQLTERSFIFSKDCRLTGGFAFSVWFAGPHQGDFVISLGGYHPAFKRPDHYPLVPRLGMRLQMKLPSGAELSITGEAYFALTPSCLMAGGKLCAVFKSGGIEAWFTAYAHFLLCWQPFYYLAEMGVALGVACRLDIGLLTISFRIELSVVLQLWGPPFGGKAVVSLWVISFTIRFGEDGSQPKALLAEEFIQKCLPKVKVKAKEVTNVFSVRLTGGLLREVTPEDKVDLNAATLAELQKVPGMGEAEAQKIIGGRPYVTKVDLLRRGIVSAEIFQKVSEHVTVPRPVVRLANAHELSLTVQSVIPCTRLGMLLPKAEPTLGPVPMKEVQLKAQAGLGIRPMGEQALDSEFSVEILDGANRPVDPKSFSMSAVTGNLPDALWGKCAEQGRVTLPKTPEAKTIEAAIGIRITCVAPQPAHALLEILIEKLKYQKLEDKLVEWEARKVNTEPDKAEGTIFDTIMAQGVGGKRGVVDERREICDCLKKQMDDYLEKKALETREEQPPFLWNEPKLDKLASETDSYFQSEITYCLLGSSYE